MNYKRLIIWILVTAVLAFCVDMAAAQRSSRRNAVSLSDLSKSFQSLSETVGPAVVQIFAVGYGPPEGASKTASSLITKRRAGGSGVILHPDGYIVTNAHVVSDAKRVQVLLPTPTEDKRGAKSILKPEGERIGAQIIGIDRETDIAVLKVPRNDLPHLELGDSDELRPGQIVLAFGSPMGLQNSVSMGVVSAVARQLGPESPMIYIQTDASINPGNSGGPLVDVEGRVVGINTLIFSHAGGSEGIGFAAPSNIVRNIYNQFRSSGRVLRGHIGIHAQTITPTLAAGLGLNRDWGVICGDVYPGGPADAAGLKVGDIILTLDGKPMENGRQLDVNLYRRPIGGKVTLDIDRNGQRLALDVTVIERADDQTQFSDLVKPSENLIPKLGILCLDIDQSIRRHLPNLRADYGVLVAARSADAPALSDRLRAGDIIYTMNSTRITDLKTIRDAAAKLKPGDAVVCQVERNGRLMYVSFEIDL
ncbi:MAG: trypsin-like peptidase domain-containing protein [Candidatus Latescibacterota bacterium]|nr:MAG: trypsin-like peptidase domain-containing protein [Candidatus Latescibacterota bacterium]